ncbi:MAG: DUF4131 domain-containing protein [Coprococcus sp.]|nr:DUF4131 domain-containing protein [Coprococcus sp.]
MKIKIQKKSGARQGKRILCRLCLAAVLMVCILQYVFGARFFRAQEISACEKALKEGEEAELAGVVYKKAVSKDKHILYLEDIQIKGKDILQEKIKERLIVYLSEDYGQKDKDRQVPKIGEQVTVSGTVGFFQESPNPGNFNQKFYYQKQNIHMALWEGLIQERDGDAVGPMDSLKESLWQFRMRTARMVCGYAGERQGGMLSSMLLGERSYADADLLEEYRQSGIGHLLAISGLHVSFLGMGIYSFLRKAGTPILPSALAGTLILCLYVVLSGASVSAVRACVMFLLRMGANLSGREYDGLTALSAAALFILARNPLWLFDAGFLLSFGAVFGIYLTAPLLWGDKKEGKKAYKTSLAMQLTVLPIQLYYYYETCVYSLAWNLIAVPMAGGIFACGMAGIFLNQIGVWLDGSILWQIGAPFTAVLKMAAKASFGTAALGLRFYGWGSGVILVLPGARWVAGQPSPVRLVIYTLSICALLALRRYMRNLDVPSYGNPGNGKTARRTLRSRPRTRFLLLFAQVLTVCLAISVLAFPQGKYGEMEAVMLNVGQGDGFFLRGPAGDTYLIDGGSSSVKHVGKYRLEPFLKSQGVGELDYVFVSHGDIDHVNGVEELLNRQKMGVKIRRLVLPPARYWDEKLKALAELAYKKGVLVFTMGQGQKFREEDLQITCLWPQDGKEEECEPGNEASMVLSVTFGEFDILFTGDLEKEGEDAVAVWIAKKQEKGELPGVYELLKAGHHGSKNASQEELLNIVRPGVVWISAGERNRYGHPHEETLERLANVGAKLYNTKDGSAVILHTDGTRYDIKRCGH